MGLTPPTVHLGDGWQAKPPIYSRKVYRYFLEVCDEIKKFTEGTERVVVFDGDTVDCDIKRRSNQYITSKEEEILWLAADALEPAYGMADRVYVVRGTDAHTGKDGYLEEMFAKDLDNVQPDPVTGDASWWWLTGQFENYGVDIAHSMSMGGRSWTEANAVNFLAAEILARYAERNEPPPQMAWRAHVHKSFDSYDNKRVRAITLPCWKLQDSYGHKLNPARWSHFGAMAFIIENGEIRKERKWKTEVSQYPAQHYRRRL